MNDDFEPDQQDEAQRQAQELERRRDALRSVLARRRTEAVNARQSSGIERIWREDEDQYNGYDEVNRPSRTEVAAMIQPTGKAADPKADKRSKVFLNITQPKTDAGEARVCEMLLPVDDQPWDFDPTPVPELGDAAKNGDQTPVRLADGQEVPAELVARVAMAKAAMKADAHAKWVDDHFVEGGVYPELRKVIKHAARIGSGVLKGPFPVAQTTRKWVTTDDGVTVLATETKAKPTSKAVSAWDFFPDPACGENLHNGSYVFERDYITARQLRKLAKDPEYDAAAISLVLEEGPRKRGRDDNRQRDFPGETRLTDSDVFEVWYYYGDLSREDLEATGMEDLPDGETHMAAIVTMVNDRPVKTVLNPMEGGQFPYDVFAWEPVDGQIWGRGIPRKMSVPQRMLNAAARAMLENAGLSAGPQMVMRKGLVTPADNSYDITGRKLWFFEGDDTTTDISQVFHVFSIPSNQAELQAIIEFGLRMADETAAMPMMLQGEQNPGRPETLGGQTMRMNAASGMLRRVAKQFDDQIVVPHLTRWYDYGMEHGPEDIKGDLKIKAKGSTTLFERDQSNQFLLQSGPLLENKALRINPERWFAEICKANHFNPATIQYTDDEWAQIQEQEAQNPAPADPRIAAAQERTKQIQLETQARTADRQADREAEAQDRAEERGHQLLMREMDREIQVMEFAGQKQISLEQLKAMLTKSAAELNTKRELFNKEAALKMSPANPTNQGI